MPYQGTALTADCYEGTVCLINKFNIRDEKQLAAVEADITLAKAMELVKSPILGNLIFRIIKRSTSSYLKIYMIGREISEPLTYQKKEPHL